MLSTYHGYMLGYWTYIAEHTTNDGISFCMNDTFLAVLWNSHVIINNGHNNHHHYISHKLHNWGLLSLPSPLCQVSVCVCLRMSEERRRRGVWWERDALAGFPVTFEFSREFLGFPEFEWLLIVPERQAGGFDAGGRRLSHSARSARRRQRWETVLNT